MYKIGALSFHQDSFKVAFHEMGVSDAQNIEDC